MTLLRRLLLALPVAALCASPAAAQLPMESMPPPQPPPLTDGRRRPPELAPVTLEKIAQLQQRSDDGFEPLSELPPDERLPAAPMLVAAYAFVLVALFFYLFSLSRRLGAVKQEIARLESDVKRSGRA